VSAFPELGSIAPQQIWDGVVGRTVHGELLTVSVVELDAGTVVPEHLHENEQLGIVLQGAVRFTVGGESRDLEAGGMWRIPANVPHSVEVGPGGAVVIDVFSPTREDWRALDEQEPRPSRWP
jgi:quercetin dioxygenase-like cupin family protein